MRAQTEGHNWHHSRLGFSVVKEMIQDLREGEQRAGRLQEDYERLQLWEMMETSPLFNHSGSEAH